MSRSQLLLMAIITGLVLVVVAVSGGIAERSLRDSEQRRLSRSLGQRAALVRELAAARPFTTANRAELDAVADRAQAASGARITLIAPDGTIVGDSDVPLDRLAEIESHAGRPEVVAAFRGDVGVNTRRSDTVGRNLLYLAVPAVGGGAVRLAVELSDVEAAVSDLRRQLVVAGAVGVAAALLVSFALSWFTLRPLREMRRAAASIAGGDLGSRVTLRSIDELGGISTAINQLAEQIRGRIEETTHEKERLQAVLDGMVEGVLVVGADGRVLLVNDRMREFYDVPREVVGLSPLEVVRDVDVDELLREAGSTDRAVSRKIETLGVDRRIFRVHAVGFPSGPGPRTGTVAVFHDITEIAKLEAIRRDFVANASHELRTPVAAIQGFSETLLSHDGIESDDQRTYLETIYRHATRLSNLVADLLDLSKIEGREAEVGPERIDVSDVARALVRDARERIEAAGLELELTAPEPAVVLGRAQDVEQILSNLLDNAANYTDAGGRIAVSVANDGNEVVFEVADSGIGIASGDQERVFERFYRVDASRSRAVGGTGLGLAIVKHLVLSLGGRIEIRSRIGRGSTFSVRVPAAGF